MALFIFLHKDVRNNRSYEYQKSGKHAVISQHYKTTLGNIDSKCRAGVYSKWSQYIVVVCKKKKVCRPFGLVRFLLALQLPFISMTPSRQHPCQWEVHVLTLNIRTCLSIIVIPSSVVQGKTCFWYTICVTER